jgi:hypothetical protein
LLNYSNFVVEAMEYVDKKIDNLNPKSLDRNRLHSKINRQIVANVKKISALKRSDAYREIDNIFNIQVLEEISRCI